MSTALTVALGIALVLGALFWRRRDQEGRPGATWAKIRRNGVAGVMARLTMWWALLGFVPVWAIYSLRDELRLWRYDDEDWGDPVFEADVAFPFAAVAFTLAAVGAGCLIRVARRDRPAEERSGMLVVAALTVLLALCTLVRLAWRHDEGISPWPYLVPVAAAAAVSTWAWLVAFQLPKRRRTT